MSKFTESEHSKWWVLATLAVGTVLGVFRGGSFTRAGELRRNNGFPGGA